MDVQLACILTGHLLVLVQGILLQIFSKPLSDRPTVFIEIIQRIGCEREVRAEHHLLPGFGTANSLFACCVLVVVPFVKQFETPVGAGRGTRWAHADRAGRRLRRVWQGQLHSPIQVDRGNT